MQDFDKKQALLTQYRQEIYNNLKNVTCLERAQQLVDGEQCHQDLELAILYYQQAKKAGIIDMQLEIVTAHHPFIQALRSRINAGLTQHDKEFVSAFKEYNYAEAYHAQSFFLPVSHQKTQLVLKAAKQGYAQSICYLGIMLANGNGIGQNPAEAVKCFQRGADLNHANSICNLGIVLANGNGIAQNPAEAVQCYQRGAGLNHAQSICALGVMLEKGIGIAQNPAEAVKCYQRAFDLGYTKAQKLLERIQKKEALSKKRRANTHEDNRAPPEKKANKNPDVAHTKSNTTSKKHTQSSDDSAKGAAATLLAIGLHSNHGDKNKKEGADNLQGLKKKP